MGSQAACLEAAVRAYGDQDDGQDGAETEEDRQWCDRWWRKLLPAIVVEEVQFGAPR